jgi:hypothetical protein
MCIYFVLIYGIFSDASSSVEFIVPNGRMTNES